MARKLVQHRGLQAGAPGFDVVVRDVLRLSYPDLLDKYLDEVADDKTIVGFFDCTGKVEERLLELVRKKERMEATVTVAFAGRISTRRLWSFWRAHAERWPQRLPPPRRPLRTLSHGSILWFSMHPMFALLGISS